MRVLRVAQELYPEVLGGGAYHAHALSRDQAAMGHDVTTVTVSGAVETPETERRDGYRVVRVPTTTTLLGADVSLDAWRHLSMPTDADVVHAHSHVYPMTTMASLRRHLDDTPLAVTCHGLRSHSVPRAVSEVHLRTLGRATYNAADVVFCYSEVERANLRDVGVDSPIIVVENGIDHGRFCPEGEASHRLDGDGAAVLFVGRLARGKRPDDAIRVAERVAEREDATLYLCGEGPLRDRLEARVRERGLEDSVQFLGTVPYGEMPALYRAADLVLLPTEAEGVPRTMLESLASETPVVMSGLEQVAPVVDAAGRTAAVGDVDGFVDAVSELVADPERRARLGAAGREIVEERFGWDLTARRTTEHLERLAARHGERRVATRSTGTRG